MTTEQTTKPAAGRSRGRPKLNDVALIENELLAIALKEFLQHGYGGASMSRVVEAAGVSKTTLYSRFPSKEALFRAIMYLHIDTLPATMSLHTPTGLPDLETGLKFYANHVLGVSFKGDLLEVNRLIYSEARRFPELGRAAAERSQLGVTQITDFIRKCAVRDGIPCRDPVAVAEAFIFMMRGWYVDVMLTKRKLSAAVRTQWVERAVRVLIADRSQW